MCAPIVVSTWSFGALGNLAAWSALSSGSSALDAVELAANAVEDDPAVDSVGLGGLPDLTGEVSLDAAVMESPSRWGSVIDVRSFQNPSSIARRIVDCYGRGMRVGMGAEEFAEDQGFTRVALLTAEARGWWEQQIRIPKDARSFEFCDANDGSLFLRKEGHHDTVGILALDSQGRLAAATSTSGLPLKPKGRVGDSALPGHGLYVVPGVGAVAATGTGEVITSCCPAFRIIDALQRGLNATLALRGALETIAEYARPTTSDQAAFILLSPDGAYAAGALRPGFRYSVISKAGSYCREPEMVLLP